MISLGCQSEDCVIGVVTSLGKMCANSAASSQRAATFTHDGGGDVV
jgi:hypothetical protein